MEREGIFKNGKLEGGAIFGYPERRESWTNNHGRDERETCRAAPSVDLRDNDQEMTGGSATITEMVTRGNQVNWQIAIDRPLTAQGTAQTTSRRSRYASTEIRFLPLFSPREGNFKKEESRKIRENRRICRVCRNERFIDAMEKGVETALRDVPVRTARGFARG